MNSRLVCDVRGDGLPVLCLHGHPGSRQCMRVFTTPLSQYCQTIAPDFRGYGGSKTSRPFEMRQHLMDIVDLLDAMQISEVVVLGWSLGGIIGTELALTYPQRVEGLILVASAAHPVSDHPPLTWRDYLFTLAASIFNRLRPGLSWNRRYFGQRSLYRYLIQNHSKGAYQHLAREAWPAFFNTSRYAHQALNRALRAGYNRLGDLDKISCPTLVLAGECDRHITMAASLKTYQALPNSEWISYPQTAHLFPWEVPNQVNCDIRRWLHHHFGAPQAESADAS
ncbi:MAG: alpha/beta hydrolase [Cyanobacteria bacterium P01_F01_bin.42]